MWTKKSYQAKKFRPRQRTKDDIESDRNTERAREEAMNLSMKLESERRAKRIEQEKQEKLQKELEEIERKQMEIKQAEDAANKYFDQHEKLWKHRLDLRKDNVLKNKSDKNSKQNKNLETKIKKIQGFLKKTKQFEKHSKNIKSLIKEMKKLKLGPYIDEVVKDLTTANISEDDIDKLLNLASAIHQRFEQKFTKPFKDGILDAFRPKLDLNDINVRKKQLLNLVILVEMQYLGLLKGGNRLIELLKHIIKIQSKHKDKLREKIKQIEKQTNNDNNNNNNDDDNVDDNNYKMEDNKNKQEITSMIYEYDDIMIHTLQLIIKFLKYANEECLGSISLSLKKHYDALGKEFKPKYHEILNSKQRKQLNEILLNYYNKISQKYCELDLKLRKQKKTNSIILIERGSISDSRQEITDKLENVVTGLRENIKLFCEHLNYVKFPIELEMDDETVTLNIDGKLTSLQDAQNASFFDDEVSRSFYESLPHLKDNIPGSLLQGDVIKHFQKNEEKKKSENKDKDEENDDDDDNVDRIDNIDINEMPKYLINNDDIVDETTMETINIDDNIDDNDNCEEKGNEDKGDKINTMKSLILALQCMGSRKETEFLAERFCYLNSKNNRKYLASFLSQIKHNDNTRLPFYARFIAILNLCDINIGDRVCLSIEKEFYRLFFSQNKQWLMDAKQNNLSYIAELTKFSIFPFNALFNILEKLSKKFNNESIELLSYFMYQCGRFLYKNPLTHIRLNKILKYLKKRQIQTNLDAFLNQHILNAIYACKPPEKSVEKLIKLTPIQQYVEHLLYFRLNHENKQSVLRKLRKLPWTDDNVKSFVIDRLFNISVINFNKIDCIAAIIQGLTCYHSFISTIIVDNVCEEIRIGLEEEDFTQEQRRLSYVKFLGELYTYKAVNSQVMMDTLYLIITYNINNNNDDESDNKNIINFRICLCCMLLETCGKYLRKGKLKSRCDRFLLYFQRFIALNLPTPFDIDWWINDVFKYIAPNMERYYELTQILNKINELEHENMTHKDALNKREKQDSNQDDQEEEDDQDGSSKEEQDDDDDDDNNDNNDNNDNDSEQSFEDDEDFEDEFEDESPDDTADVNSYHRKKKITKHDRQFIDEYEAMMEQYRAPTTRKTNISNLKHASILFDTIQKKEQKQAVSSLKSNSNTSDNDKYNEQDVDVVDDDDDFENEYQDETVSFKLLSKKGATSTKLKVGVIKIPKQIIDSIKVKQKKETKSLDKIKSVTLQHLQNYEEDEENDINNYDYDYQNEEYDQYEMVDDNNNIISSSSMEKKTKSRMKQYSISSKRKYKDNLKQMQHQKIEDEKEKQKNQRDAKRKKQSKYAEVTQDF